MLNGFPPFRPHPLLRGGHLQTLAGVFLPGYRHPYRAARHAVRLADGDRIILHDDQPVRWKTGDQAAILVHGLSGCYESGYMVRIAAKLNAGGVRAFRMDQRSCGAGMGLARLPYHAGRSEDLLAATQYVTKVCPGTRVTIVGFSLGGNIVLKLLGEAPESLPGCIERAMAVNPSLDLSACIDWIERPAARMYDRHFVKLLNQHIAQSRRILPEGAIPLSPRTPQGIREFDDLYTAPLAGFGTAANYYARCSAAQFIERIRIPTLVLTARDDPLVPFAPFERLKLPETVRLIVSDSGGHLGYVGRTGVDADRRWMDWRVVDWVTCKTD